MDDEASGGVEWNSPVSLRGRPRRPWQSRPTFSSMEQPDEPSLNTTGHSSASWDPVVLWFLPCWRPAAEFILSTFPLGRVYTERSECARGQCKLREGKHLVCGVAVYSSLPHAGETLRVAKEVRGRPSSVSLRGCFTLSLSQKGDPDGTAVGRGIFSRTSENPAVLRSSPPINGPFLLLLSRPRRA